MILAWERAVSKTLGSKYLQGDLFLLFHESLFCIFVVVCDFLLKY
jgi:hypothetical protein